MSKNIMINILKEIDKYPELVKNFSTLSDEQKSRFLSAIRGMNRGMLYDSPIHGEYHSEKVTLFCVLLGVKLGCTNKELDILIDAGMYHDNMRDSDREDTFHGLSSAYNIERVINKGKYTQQDLAVLKSIIDYHSADTSMHTYENIAFNHDVSEERLERGELLANILRDADALDRCRFSQDSVAYLKPQYLKYQESVDLIKLAEEINEAYLGKMFTDQEVLSNPYLHRNSSACLHSVGKNLFRLNSVLENGLLSHYRLVKTDPSFSRNFDGGNSDKWISVVPTNKAVVGTGASREFLRHGIVFLFDKTDLYYPDERVNSSYARSYGLPYTKNSGYSDEQYAFDFIPKEKICGIYLDKELANSDLSELSHYVYDSFNYDLFEKNVISILSKVNGLENGNIPEAIVPLMKRYKEIDEEADGKSLMLQDMYADKLMKISNSINEYIGLKLKEYYQKKLGLSSDARVTFEEAVLYELKMSNYDYERLPGDDIYYMLTPKEDFKKKGTYL